VVWSSAACDTPPVNLRTPSAWATVRQRKRLHWRAQYRRHGPNAALRVAEDLRDHMESIRADWPDAETRRKDWEHHRRMRLLFDRMGHALIHYARRQAAS
jgi:hypothetical protein